MIRFQDILEGISSFFKGFHYTFNNRFVLKTFIWITVATLIITISLQVLGVWATFHFTEGMGEGETGFLKASLEVLRIGLVVFGIASSIIVAPLFAVFICCLLLEALCDQIFMATLTMISSERAKELSASEGLPFRVSMHILMRRIIRYLGLSLFVFMVSLVPIFGQIIAPVLQFWLSCRFVGWVLLDPYFDRLKYQYQSQLSFMRDHSWLIFGFSVPAFVLLSIPVIGPFSFPIAQSAVAELVSKIEELSQRSERIL